MSAAVEQAEATLRTAALAYVEANNAYAEAYERNNDFERYRVDPNAPLHPETQEKVRISNVRLGELTDAARNLAQAIADEQMQAVASAAVPS